VADAVVVSPASRWLHVFVSGTHAYRSAP